MKGETIKGCLFNISAYIHANPVLKFEKILLDYGTARRGSVNKKGEM